jgi:hypothetical protein
MTRAVVIVLLSLGSVAACGGSQAAGPDGGNPGDGGLPGGKDSGGGNDGGGNDGGGEPQCQDVCWAPRTPPVTDPAIPPPVTDITVTRCNAGGLTPEVCPAGFACTGMETRPLDDTHTFSRPVCEPVQQPVAPLILDLRLTVPVRLTFTLNGGPWPTGGGAEAAGTILFSARSSGTSISRPIPTQSGELDVDLAVGVYDVSIFTSFITFDSTRYPVATLVGVLTVVAAGNAQLELVGQPLTFALRLDGAPFPPLVDGDALSLTFAGHHGQRTLLLRSTRSGSTEASGVVVLAPDRYRVTLEVFASSRSAFPSGDLVLADSLEVTAARSVTFDLTTYPVSGAVRIDGADAPAQASPFVHFGDNQFTVSAPPSRYQGRLLHGSNYDVILRASSSATTPRGVTRVTSSFLDGPETFDIDIATTTFSGAITLNGAAPPAATNRGALVLDVPGTTFAGERLSLDASGDARWSRRVLAGTYDVRLAGQNVFPTYTLPLESSVAIVSPVTRNYNIDAGTVNLELRVDGAQPPDATAGRGDFVLRRRGAGSTRLVFAAPPSTGPFATSLMLEAGVWEVEVAQRFGTPALPVGSTDLTPVTVGAGGLMTTTYDVHSVVLTGELRRQGAVPAPGTRGNLTIQGTGFGLVALPTTGPAAFNVRAFPGVYDFVLVCNEGCGDLLSSGSLQLASGIRYP